MSAPSRIPNPPDPLACAAPSPSFPKSNLPSLLPLLIAFLDYLTTIKVHEVYAPFMILSVMHAVRVGLVWAGMRRGREGKGRGRGVGEGLFGYLVLAWGGGTAASLLMSQPPTWLISPTPWLIYPLTYLLLIPTGLAAYFVSTCPPLLLSLLGSIIDALARGVPISALPSALSSGQQQASWITPLLLSAIATCAGGWIVQTFGLAEDEWRIGLPSVLQGGIMGTLDVWAAMLVAFAHGGMRGSHPEFMPVTTWLRGVIPVHLQILGGGSERTAMVDPGVARAISVLLLGSLLILRVAINAFSEGGKASVPKKGKAAVEAIKASAEKGTATTGTPRKVSQRQRKEDEGEKGVKSPASTRKEKASTPRSEGLVGEVVKSPTSVRKERTGTPSKSLRQRGQ